MYDHLNITYCKQSTKVTKTRNNFCRKVTKNVRIKNYFFAKWDKLTNFNEV
jgi:hypothetical protein